MVIGRSSISDRPESFAEAKLAGAISWLLRPDTSQFVAYVQDDNALKALDFTDLISHDERLSAAGLADHAESRHFVFRRAFQRCFVKKAIGWPGHPSELPLLHSLDARPACLAAPGICLSFSSSGSTAIGAATRLVQTGIDIENHRTVDNIVALSTRFFESSESAYLRSLPEQAQALEFLRFWTIKEACLKAVGKGVVDGLEKFTISKKRGKYSVGPQSGLGQELDWSIEVLDLPLPFVATLAIYKPG